MGIKVYIWDKFVGALVETTSGIAFEYDRDFIKTKLELSPIMMPLNGKKVYINEANWKNTNGIPGFINDSLPDSFGENLLTAYFKDKGLTEKDINVFSKLQYIGSRGMGALEYKPSMDVDVTKDAISMEDIEKVSMLALKGKESLNTNLKDKNALLQIIHVGSSAGGARAKAFIAINKKTGEIKSGQLFLGNEYDYYLIKIDGANKSKLNEPTGYGRLEYTYYQMAVDCGIVMSKSTLYDNTHFMTKRFDRDENGDKIHIHSLCGLMSLDYNAIGSYSYEQYIMTARRIGLGMDSLEEIYKRMVFNVLMRNCDDHTKNFSFKMNRQGEWSLSPAFDLCYSYNSSNAWVNGHNMTINGKRKNITIEDMLLIGERFNIKKRDKLIERVKEVASQFVDYAKSNDVPKSLIQEVKSNLPSNPPSERL